jgi:predicted DNA-binding transcriptional regulator AlpA
MNPHHIVVQPTRLGFLSSQNLCAELGISPRTARRWTKRGQLPSPRRLGRQAFWSVEEVRAALSQKGGDK